MTLLERQVLLAHQTKEKLVQQGTPSAKISRKEIPEPILEKIRIQREENLISSEPIS